MLQRRPKNSLQDTESQLDQNYKAYTQVVSDVLEAYYMHSLRNPPDNFDKMVANWANLFIKCGIPASQLMDLYLEAHANMDKGAYFNADTIIAVWNEKIQQRLQEERIKEPCGVCKGQKKTIKYNFRKGVDEEIDCPKCTL